MKLFKLAFCTVMAVGSYAMPQYGPGGGSKNSQRAAASPQRQPQGPNIPQNLPDGCRIEYKNFQTIVEIEREDVVCTPWTE